MAPFETKDDATRPDQRQGPGMRNRNHEVIPLEILSSYSGNNIIILQTSYFELGN